MTICHSLKEWNNVLRSVGDDFLLSVLHGIICEYLFPCCHTIPNTMNLPLWQRKIIIGNKVYTTEWLYGRRGRIICWSETVIRTYQGVFDNFTHWSEIDCRLLHAGDLSISASGHVRKMIQESQDFPDTEPVFFIINRLTVDRPKMVPARPYYMLWLDSPQDIEPNAHELGDYENHTDHLFQKYMLISDYDKHGYFYPTSEPMIKTNHHTLAISISIPRQSISIPPLLTMNHSRLYSWHLRYILERNCFMKKHVVATTNTIFDNIPSPGPDVHIVAIRPASEASENLARIIRIWCYHISQDQS